MTLTLMGLVAAGCGAKLRDVRVKQDVTVAPEGETAQSKKAGEVFGLGGKPVWVEAPGHYGLLIVPIPQDARGDIEVALRPGRGGDGSAVNDLVAQVVAGVVRVQSLLIKGKSQQALDEATQLLNRYPAIGVLWFLKASCQVVMGQSESAVDSLETGLKIQPNQPDARDLLDTLKAKRRPASGRNRSGP